MRIESSDKKIDELLKGNTFLIPRFQRPYSWEAEQIVQFWTDINDNVKESYFIGSMVVYKNDRSSLAIVDGQQRLTTVILLLCAIREAYKLLGSSELANGLQAYIEQKSRDNKTVYVLTTETSFPFLQEEVLKNAPSDIKCSIGKEEEAISRAYEILRLKLKHEIDGIMSNKELTRKENVASAINWLSDLRDTVFDLNTIVVTLDNEDDAYLIFETLNTRGKDLALSDLIRNQFTKFLRPKGGVDQATIKWAKVLDTISGAPQTLDQDMFIVHSWQSRYEFATKAKVFPKFKSRVNSKNAKDHLDRFVSDSLYWRSIVDPESKWGKPEKNVRLSFQALRLFKVTQPTPGLLSLVRAYRDKVIRYRHLRDAVAMIENFHFAFNPMTSSRSSGGISGMYSLFGRQVFNASTSSEALAAVSDLRIKLQERVPDEQEFDVGFRHVGFTNSNASQKGLVQYILRKVAMYENQPHQGDTDDLTIEHIVPQSTAKGFSTVDLGRIGNLLLVDAATNGKLADKSFLDKKAILQERGYKLPDVLAEADEINPEVILANTLRIAKLARESIWKV